MTIDVLVRRGALAPMVAGNPERSDLGDELHTSFCSTDTVMARQFAEATFLGDNRSDLAKLPVPSLVLQCSEDAIAPEWVGEYVARVTPNSTFRQLQATGHCPHLSHPHEAIAAMQEYLGAAVAA